VVAVRLKQVLAAVVSLAVIFHLTSNDVGTLLLRALDLVFLP
jgi:hypothetical protein